MKTSKFSDAQKAFVIKHREEGRPVAEVCGKAEISQATYFNWKKKYAGLLPTEMRHLRQLEEENSRLKKIVADLTLDRKMLQDVSKRLEGRRSAAQPTLRGRIGSVSWSAGCCSTGACRSGEPLGFRRSTPPVTTISPAATIRPF